MTEPLVFQHGALEVAFNVVVAACVAFELAMTIRQRRRAGSPPARDWTALLLVACFAGSILAAEGLGRGGLLMWPGDGLWPVAAGFGLIAVGLGLRAWSIATLGRLFQYWITVQAGHRVITDGPYRYVRHPSYTGMGLMLIGMALASGDALSLAVVLSLSCLGFALRIRAEERQLTDTLGQEYERYASARKRLLPGVW